jgi:DNA ligase-1
MHFGELVETYREIENTTKRLEITSHLVELLKKTPPPLIDKVVYLLQGKIYPDFVNIELGIAEKLAIKAISVASGFSEGEVEKRIRDTGDIGEATEELMKSKKQSSFFREDLTVESVYGGFVRIAKAQGKDSQDVKIRTVCELLQNGEPEEDKYMIRTLLGRLRLGIADMTILDALAQAFATKEARAEIERAYNVYSDLGAIAKELCEKSVEGLRDMRIQVGIPVKAMLAERARSIEEILGHISDPMVEYKYDGIRLQAHVGKEVSLFSRRLENLTEQFPDIVKALKSTFRKEVIVEGECVAMNPETGEMLPFQAISHRRGRKYDVEATAREYPASLFLFDCLYADGVDMTRRPLAERRKKLEKLLKPGPEIRSSHMMRSSDRDEIEAFFLKAIEDGCEGVMAKAPDSEYKAGARGWSWIKYKRDYKSEMIDTVDLVVVGGFAGQGRRAGTYGALLLACYNPDEDVFETVCKVGTGFDDKTLAGMREMFDRTDKRPARVRSEIEADYWFEPGTVMEILGAEITLSPVHTCAKDLVRKGSGLAIRFPRFTGNWREDKSAEEATTTSEIIEIYKKQLKKVEG